jgi:tight adherence protein B
MIWLGVATLTVGLWLLHAGLQAPSGGTPRPRRASGTRLRLQDWLVQAGLERWTPTVLVVLWLASTVLCALVARAVFGWPLFTGLAGLFGLVWPILWLRARHARRRAEIQQGLADLLAHLRTSLGQGYGVTRGLQALSEDGPERLRPHLAQLLLDADEASLVWAVRRFGDRLADPVVDLVCAALELHAELGGNSLSKMLAQLEQMVRVRLSIQDRVRATRARVLYGATIVVAWPLIALALLRWLQPDAARFYETPGGQLLLLVCAVVMCGGYLWMLWLGKLPGQERVLVR